MNKECIIRLKKSFASTSFLCDLKILPLLKGSQNKS